MHNFDPQNTFIRDSRYAYNGSRYQVDKPDHDWLYLVGAIAVIIFAAWMRFS